MRKNICILVFQNDPVYPFSKDPTEANKLPGAYPMMPPKLDTKNKNRR